MEQTKLKPLKDDPSYYTKAFHVFAKRSTKSEILAKWEEKFLPPVVERLVERLPSDSTVRMLRIGSGSGQMDSRMATKIRARFKAVHNTVIEPAASQLDMYRKLISSGKEEFAGIDFDLHQDTLDGYRRKLNETGVYPKYHFISAIHSVYYVDDLNDTIRYLHECLEDGGMLFIVVISDTSGTWRFWKRYPRFQNKNQYMCTQGLRDVLTANAIPFTVVSQTFHLDITSCFDPESEEGNLIVDFLSQVCNLRESVTQEVHQEVLDYLGSAECSERKDDGTVLFNSDWDAIIVQKGTSQS
ncbi:LOW QUALITY PROTEIN: histamine N-methyltransferase A-like [Diadema setosum]|uniref:LOW QUALITY PROTEIN: histamine N-methyltransferase A-like n=1 Tax=Diadema setosum TaxID=31175 RepID=UPI003B3B45C9